MFSNFVLSQEVLGYPLLYRGIFGYLWQSCDISGYHGIYLALSPAISGFLGYLRLSLAIFGHLWLSLSVLSYLALSLAIFSYLWQSLVISGYVWLYLAITRYIYQVSRASYCYLKHFHLIFYMSKL